jgi:hypothetical protein
MEGLLLLQLPVEDVLVSAVLNDVHTDVAPLMLPASGSGLTVRASVVCAVPQLKVVV